MIDKLPDSDNNDPLSEEEIREFADVVDALDSPIPVLEGVRLAEAYDQWLAESPRSPLIAAGEVSPEEIDRVSELLRPRSVDDLGRSALDSDTFKYAIYKDGTEEQD
ncbi:MAG TPA: hypothetical protein VGE34_00380 [Candidatus Saccharimonadales bacterium]